MKVSLISSISFKRKQCVGLVDLLDFANLDQFEEIDLRIEHAVFHDLSKTQVYCLAENNGLIVRFISCDLIDGDPDRQRIDIWTERLDKKYSLVY